MSAGVIKNQVKINERYSDAMTPVKSARKESIGKDSYLEYSELKLEAQRNKEQYEMNLENLNTKIKELEKKVSEQEGHITGLKIENEGLKGECDMLKNRIKYFEQENCRLRRDNDDLIQLLNELEATTKSDLDKKASEFQEALQCVEKKLKEVDSEVRSLYCIIYDL